MATRSAVGYVNAEGDFRGTYVHFDGYPENAIPEIKQRLEKVGYEGFVE